MIGEVWRESKNYQLPIARKFLNQLAKNIPMRKQKKSEIYFTNLVNWITAYQWI